MYDLDELIKYHQEAEYLDFKREEYNENNKVHLIKDVLAFANANISGDKYIIIGVDKKQGDTELFNIVSKLDSANVQQYVHDNITPDLVVDYYPHKYQGFDLMVLQIKDPAERPYFTEKKVHYKNGGLFMKAAECWIRKGSYQLPASRPDFEKIYNARKMDELTKEVTVTFEDGSTVLEAAPKFNRVVTYYHKRQPARINDPMISMMLGGARARLVSYTFEKTYNQSFFPFRLIIHNSGLAPIENYKLLLEFFGEIQTIAKSNDVEGGGVSILARPANIPPSTVLDADKLTGKITPHVSPLVSEESFASQEIFLKPKPEKSQITIKWKLISRDHKQQGELIIDVTPDIVIKRVSSIISSGEERTETGDIEDYIGPIED